MIGLGTQDDFALARDFLDRTGVETPTMLWDPGFSIWQAFGVQANSQMMVVSADLQQGTGLTYGFDDDRRAAILEALADL